MAYGTSGKSDEPGQRFGFVDQKKSKSGLPKSFMKFLNGDLDYTDYYLGKEN